MLCEVIDCGKIVPTLLLVQNVDCQISFINMTMVHNVKAILCKTMSWTQLIGFGGNFLCLPSLPINYCNFSLGLTTKIRACEGVGQEWSPGVTFHAPGNVGMCEEMNFRTPKWAPILRVGVLMDFQIFREQLQG